VAFGFDCTTFNAEGVCTAGSWAAIPQKPIRAVGGLTQLSFPLSRIFDANPVGRNAGWTFALTAGIDEAKARDVRVLSSSGGRSRSDALIGTLNYKLNQYFTFAYEISDYRSFATCFPVGTGVLGGSGGAANGENTAAAGGFPGPGGGLVCSGTPFIQQPGKFTFTLPGATTPTSLTLANGAARAWHDMRQEFGPIVTF